MDEYLTKPIDTSALTALVTQMFPGATPPVAVGPNRRSFARTGSGLPVDVDVLRNLTQAGGPDVVKVVVDLFLETVEQGLGDLRAVIAIGDAKLIKLAAHRLKGSCSGVGARGAAAILQQLETPADDTDAGALMAELHAEMTRVRQALSSYRRSGSGAFKMTGGGTMRMVQGDGGAR